MKIIFSIFTILTLSSCASDNYEESSSGLTLLNRDTTIRQHTPQPQKSISTQTLPSSQQNTATQLSKLSKSELASRQLKIKNMPASELISRRYTLESERILKTRDSSDIENELIMVNEQLIKGSPDRFSSNNNTQDNSGRGATITEALLITVAPVHVQTMIFETQKRQWNNNVRFGAAPISSAYLRMINQEVPELYRNLSVCSKKYGGGEINPQTIMNFLNQDESFRVQSGFLGLVKDTVQTPTRQNLNGASENELVLKLLLNKFQDELKYKTDKKMYMNWCDKVGAMKFRPSNSK